MKNVSQLFSAPISSPKGLGTFLQMNIRSKLVILLLVFGVVPILSVMPIVLSALGDLRQATLNAMQEDAHQISDLIDRNLFERYGDVQAFGVNSVSQDTKNWYRPAGDSPLVTAMNKYVALYGFYKVTLLVDLG